MRRFLSHLLQYFRPPQTEVAERHQTSEIERAREKGAHIGENVRVYGVLDKVNPQLITIGDHCVIGTHSAVLAHCPIRGGVPVSIGDRVWIGFNVCILPGVEIGDCSVIGAGSVVTSSVPEGSIVAGNPARVLRPLTEDEKSRLSHCLINRLPIGKSQDPQQAE